MIRLIEKISWKINISTFNSLFLQSFPSRVCHIGGMTVCLHIFFGEGVKVGFSSMQCFSRAASDKIRVGEKHSHADQKRAVVPKSFNFFRKLISEDMEEMPKM